MRKRIVGCILWICICFIQVGLKQHVDSFQMADSWSQEVEYHHIGTYFSSTEQVTPEYVEKIRMKLDAILTQNKIAGDDTKYHWIDAYSGSGSYYALTHNDTFIQVTTIGVGGDFFWFHSNWNTHRWCAGNAFWPDTEKRQVVLTESCAWKLFGAVDVVGMEVPIGQNTYMVLGVVKDDTDFFATEAGFNPYTIYMPYNQLKQEIEDLTVTHYEVIFPEVIPAYAYNKVNQSIESIGIQGIVKDKTEQSSLSNQWNAIVTLPSQIMKTDEIQFSYWENEASVWLFLLAITTGVLGVVTVIVGGMIGSSVVGKIRRLKGKRKH